VTTATIDDTFCLRDGRQVRIRPIGPDDADRLIEFHTRLSPRSQELRFHRPKPRLQRWEAEYLAGVDHVSRTAIVATVLEDGEERIVADARLDLTGPGQGEAAFVVRDDHQGAGLGGELVTRITGIAEELGLASVALLVLSANAPMLRLAERAGASRLGTDGPACLLSVPLGSIRTGTEDIRVQAA